MCQCVARNDCTVEVAGFVYNMDPGACIPGVPRRHDQRHEGADARRAAAFRSSSTSRPISTPASSWRCRCPACPATAATRWSTSSAATTRLDFVDQEEARRRRFGMAVQGRRRRRARRAVRAARRGDVLSQPRQEHPVHRRRQRHRRHDVDPRARAAGALFRPVQRLRVLRRAHVSATAFYLAELVGARARVPGPPARDDRAVGRSRSGGGAQRASRARVRARAGARSRGQGACRASTRTCAPIWPARRRRSTRRFACCCCRRSCRRITSATTSSADALDGQSDSYARVPRFRRTA